MNEPITEYLDEGRDYAKDMAAEARERRTEDARRSKWSKKKVR